MNWTEKRREIAVAWLFLLPSLLGTIIFWIGPAVGAFGLSMFEWDMISDPIFKGIDNFKHLMEDPLFRKSLWNTFYYTIVSVPIAMTLSLMLALLLNNAMKGLAFFRTLYFLPVISSTVAVALVWRWIYNKDYGLLNTFLSWLHLPQPNWLGSTAWSMPAIILMSVWKEIGYFMVIYLAGLQGMPKDLYEAADLDGATPWQQFWKITFPLLSPTTFFILIIALISGFQVFDQAYVMTQGGPADSTMTVVYYLYKQGFGYFQMGYAAAVACALFLIILMITLLQWFVTQRKVFYQ
jgi:multiple sugar transport system permease protein